MPVRLTRSGTCVHMAAPMTPVPIQPTRGFEGSTLPWVRLFVILQAPRLLSGLHDLLGDRVEPLRVQPGKRSSVRTVEGPQVAWRLDLRFDDDLVAV